MANFRRLFSVTIVISLLLSIGVLFISQLATAGDGWGKPEESILYEASKSWDVAEPNIDVDQDYLDFTCSAGGSTPNMAATFNQLDFECTTPTLSSYVTLASNDKIEMMLIDSPPTPPVDVSRTIANVGHLSESAVMLSGVPTSEWTYGCTATSAGMLFGYYDRTGYPNMYTGSTNGGVCPLTDLGQGIFTNPRYPISGSCYIIATENGLDGISSNAHVDDYWISYGSAGPDPWEGNWAEHTWGLCTADFLGTNQWKWDYSSYPGTDGTKDTNTDGSTAIWNYNDGSKLYDWCPGPAYGLPTTSCCHGLRLFAESRGYSVETNYNQLTDNQNSNGFTFAEFQSEINAGRPVLIHVVGHTMVGIGYDTSTNSIYIHDTWDNDIHSMTWGGSYAGMALYAVTVIHLAPPTEYSLTISSTSGGSVITPGEGVFTYGEGTVIDLVAIPDAMVTAGWGHTVGLKSDGTVVAVGYDDYGQCNVDNWTDIVQVATSESSRHTVGLKSDGSVVAVGSNNEGQCNVGNWTNIIQVATGSGHTVGLKSDGTVVAVGRNVYGQCNVSSWTNIIQVAADSENTVGLKSDGTVVAVGDNSAGQCNVASWTGIVQVAAGWCVTVGLKADGTVVAVGRNIEGQCSVSSWTNIIQVAAGYMHTVGLKSDGSVVAVGWDDNGSCSGVTSWTGIVQVTAGYRNTVGLRCDGTVVAVGGNPFGQCNVSSWMLFAHRFANWTGNVSTIGNVTAASTNITMHGDYSITANFVAVYDLTTSSTAGGNITTPGEGTFIYDEGTVVDLVATPDVGCRFVNWTGNVGTIGNVTDASTNITMNGDYSITANFVKVYDLTTNSTAGGNVTTPGEGNFTYDEGTVVSLNATLDAGYRFANWTGDVGTIGNITAASTNITMNGDYSITANFVAIYDLTTSSTAGGNVTTPGEGTFTYDQGTVVELLATPGAGYRFDEWTGDVGTVADINAATTNITMNGDYTIIANFVALYDLTIDSTIGGNVTTPGEGLFPDYDAGTVVNLVATPGAGYRFDEWTGDVGTIGNVTAAATNITMNGDYSITANFVALYDLMIESTVGGNVTTPGEGLFPDYDAGMVVDLVATSDAGYRFDEWTGDVGTVADVNAASTNITMNGDYSITANFEEIPKYDLTTFSTSGGNVTTPGEGTFEYYEGTVVDLVATPDASYRFDEWTGNVSTIGNVTAAATNITMNGDYYITAEFVRQYDLSVNSTEGGSVNTPGEGVFTYDKGTVVDLVATPNAMVVAGCYQTAGLKDDGTVVAVGLNHAGQCNVSDWTDIVQVSAGWHHTVGLESDGTVVAVGYNNHGQCDVGGWTGIIKVASGS